MIDAVIADCIYGESHICVSTIGRAYATARVSTSIAIGQMMLVN